MLDELLITADDGGTTELLDCSTEASFILTVALEQSTEVETLPFFTVNEGETFSPTRS